MARGEALAERSDGTPKRERQVTFICRISALFSRTFVVLSE